MSPSPRRPRSGHPRGRPGTGNGPDHRPDTSPDTRQGLPGHHDPTAGIGGAAPAQSALTLRLVLATFGLVVCTAGGIGVLLADAPRWFAVVLLVLAAVALVDLVVVARRKLRGEPG